MTRKAELQSAGGRGRTRHPAVDTNGLRRAEGALKRAARHAEQYQKALAQATRETTQLAHKEAIRRAHLSGVALEKALKTAARQTNPELVGDVLQKALAESDAQYRSLQEAIDISGAGHMPSYLPHASTALVAGGSGSSRGPPYMHGPAAVAAGHLPPHATMAAGPQHFYPHHQPTPRVGPAAAASQAAAAAVAAIQKDATDAQKRREAREDQLAAESKSATAAFQATLLALATGNGHDTTSSKEVTGGGSWHGALKDYNDATAKAAGASAGTILTHCLERSVAAQFGRPEA